MPFPTASQVPQFESSAQCNQSVSLAAITAAIIAADSSDQEDFWNALANCQGSGNGLSQIFGLIVATGDTADLTAIINNLDSDRWFYSPTNPDPSIATINTEISTIDGNITTLQGGVTTLNSEVATQATEIATLSAEISGGGGGGGAPTPDQIVEVFAMMNEVQLTDVGVSFYSAPENCQKIEVHNETDEETQPWLEAVTAGCALTTLFLHNATGEEVPDTYQDTVWAPDCDMVTGQPVRVPLNVPFIGNAVLNEKPLWQQLFNILNYLLRCCPPCNNHDWTLKGVTDGSVQATGIINLDAVRLNVAEENFSLDTTLGNPETTFTGDNTGISVPPAPWVRLGQIHWIYADGTKGEMMLWRFHEQVFRCPTGDVVGYEILSAPGLTYSIYQRFTETSHGFPTW